MGNLNKTASEPKQARAKETYNKLLSASQHILETQGLEALNSNAIVKEAGLTPPAFYRYFDNKYSVLGVLCERFMQAQNDFKLPPSKGGGIAYEQIVLNVEAILKHTVKVTREFKGSLAVLQAMRAIPDLRPIRLKSHSKMAKFIAEVYPNWSDDKVRASFIVRARLALEIGYAMLELLSETNYENEDIIVSRSAHAAAAVFGDILENLPD